MKSKRVGKYNILTVALALLTALVFSACVAKPQQEEPLNIQVTRPEDTSASKKDVSENESENDDEDIDENGDEGDDLTLTPFSTYLPEEFMAYFEGHELSVDDNPVIGTYVTTSGCIMILLGEGYYVWQDNDDAPAITGMYELYEGTVSGSDDGSNSYVLESDTGPLYTVIVAFHEGNGARAGTIQVFDYQDEDLYYVTDLINNIWFEATRIL